MKNIRNSMIFLYTYISFSIIFVLRFHYIVTNDAYSDNFFQDWLFSITLIVVLVTLVLGVFALIKNYLESKRIFIEKEIKLLTRRMKILKLGLIPFYILNFVLYMYSFLLLLAASRGWILFSPLIIVFIFVVFLTYGIVILTSYDGIALANIYFKNKIISRNMYFVLAIMQLLFVFDIVATILILFNRDFLDYQLDSN